MKKKRIIELLIPVICDKGYSEMSISYIAEIVGLKKSSFYHFFPEGKEQMALEIVLFIDHLLTTEFTELMNERCSPSDKYHQALDILSKFYKDGTRSCLIDVMTISGADKTTQKVIKELLFKLVNIFRMIFLECGFDNDKAHEKAVQIIILIQGSLIFCRATGEYSFFSNLINSLKKESFLTKEIELAEF